MEKAKYRCPRCGNTDLVFAKETTTRRLYKMGANGIPDETEFETIERTSHHADEFLECHICNMRCDFNDLSELEEWENK